MLLNDVVEERFREVGLVALMLVVGAAIMWLADHWGRKRLLAVDLTFPKALGLGFAQALALIPGVSRSGISISAGLFAGLDRESAARFSFLMATPITAAAAAYELVKLIRGDLGVAVEWLPLIAGMVAALVSGLLAIRFLLRYLRTRSLNIFVAYRLVLAAVVLVVFLER